MPERRSGLKPVLRNRAFLVFSFTQAISLLGDKLDYMALLALLAFFAESRGMDSSRAIATLSVVAALPVAIFGPFAGVLVDRTDRRRVMVLCDVLRAVIVFAVPFAALATGSIALVFALSFLVFLCGLFFNSARMATIPGLVGHDDDPDSDRLTPANSFMNLTGRIATFIGMVAGGLVVDWQGWTRLGLEHSWTAGFYLDSVTYLVSVLGLIIIYRRLGRFAPAPRPDAGQAVASLAEAVSRRLRHVWSDLVEAWRLVASTPAVLFAYASVVVLVVAGSAFLVLYVPIIQGTAPDANLDLGTRGVGFFAGFGAVGLVISSAAYGVLGHRLGHRRVISACFLVLGAVAGLLSFTRSFAMMAPLALLGGLALSPVYIGMDTLIHRSVPAGARGRVFSSREWVMHVAFGLSAFLMGQLTRLVSNRKLLLAVGVLTILAGIAGFFMARTGKAGKSTTLPGRSDD